MTYAIVTDGIVTNIIVADEAFAARIGALPVYDGCAIGTPYQPPESEEPTAEEQLRADVDYIAAMTGVEL